MTVIITHPGSAHLDDFLSCCLVINKSKDITKIKRKEPDPSEVKDPNIWKLDVGEIHDPAKKCFDHHQKGMGEECTLSLLLKHWGAWSIANEVHRWLKYVVIKDASGPLEVIKQLEISYTIMGVLDSFVQRTILDHFREQRVIKKGHLLFSLMEIIGNHFFELIDEYTTTLEEVNKKIEFEIIEGVQTVLCPDILGHSSTLVRIIKDKMREKWPDLRGGIAVYPNKRVKGSIAIKRFENDPRVDFTRISDYEKVIYSHPEGFFISVEQIPEELLKKYIKDAIIK